jgi:RNA polymerase sigma-70 factor (ECF subfamily)
LSAQVNPMQPIGTRASGGIIAVTFARRGQKGSVLAVDPDTLCTRSSTDYAYASKTASPATDTQRVALADGGSVLLWTEGSAESGRRAMAQSFAAWGTPRSAPVVLSPAGMDVFGTPRAATIDEVYDLLAPRLLGYFTRQLGDHGRAEDLVQQTLLQMHAARRNYATGSDVVPWAFAIGRNALIDGRRRTRKEVLFQTREDEAAALDHGVDRASCPDDLAAANQMAGLAQEQLHRLPETQRAAYNLVRGEGLSVAETAEILGTTPTAVKLRVHRVYEALRSVLGAKEPVAP